MKFIKKMLVYFIGTVFSKTIMFIMLPIYTNNFSPASYGDNDLAVTTVTMLISLFFMELWTPLLRFSYDENTEKGKNKIFSNIMFLSCICLPIYIAGCIFMGKWQHLPNIGWMILYGYSLLIIHVYQFEVRATGRSYVFMISGMISSILQFILSLILIYRFNLGAEVMLIAPFISNIVAVIYIEITYRYLSKLKLSFYSSALIKNIAKYAFPLAINAVAFWGMTNINRYFARNYLGSNMNGYIALATKFAALISTIVQIYALAWQESAYEHSNSHKRATYYSKMLGIYLDVMTLGCTVAIIGTNIIFPLFISSEYNPTQLILPIYYISAFMNAISNFYGHIFNAEKKTDTLLYSTLAGAIINIFLLYATINKWGIYSVPIALTAGYLANVAMRIYRMQKIVEIKFNIKEISVDIFILVCSMLTIYTNAQLITKIIFVILCLFIYAIKHRKFIKKITEATFIRKKEIK